MPSRMFSDDSNMSLGAGSVGSQTDVSSLTRDSALLSSGSNRYGGASSSFIHTPTSTRRRLSAVDNDGHGHGDGDGSNDILSLESGHGWSGTGMRDSLTGSVGYNSSRQSVGYGEKVVTESERNKNRQLGTLRFDRLDIFGRDDEKKQLQEALHHVAPSTASVPHDNKRSTDKDKSNGSSSEYSERTTKATNSIRSRGNGLALIAGESGVGKTTLSKHLQKTVKKSNGLFVQGQFDMTTIGQPFAGIKAACLQVCGELMYLKTQYRSRWSKIVNDLVELPELGQILQLIPDLEDCLMDDQCQSQDDKYRSALEDAQRTRRRVSASSMDDRASAKLYESFRRFTRVISSHFRPFVMVLDDLQRADNGSLQLVQSILTDTSSSGLLVVGTYRSNEVDEEHPLHRFTEELDMDSKNEGSGLAKMAQIKLSNFDEAQVKEILVVVLNLNGDETGLDALASVCYRRTLGNMFYLSRFLLTLKDDGLLQFNVALWSWQWEIESITAFSAASENVVDFMRSQLLELPTAIQKRLSMAAYLGTLFDVETEQIVWDAVGKDDEDTDNWFEMSESRGILEDCGDGLWRWAHDQVQLSARRLVQQDEIRFLKMRMARALLEGLPETKRDFYTFTIVDLLNSDEDSDVEPNLEMAILNRNATKKAASQVGLESMRHYAMAGLKYLPKNSFQNDATYKLSIELVSYAIEAGSLLSDEELISSCMTKIDQLPDRPLLDKMRAYKARIRYLARQKDSTTNARGLAFTIDVLGQLGVKFPRSKVRQLVALVKGLTRAKSKAKAVTVEEMLTDKRPVDPIDLQALQILVLSMESCFLTQPDLLPLWLLKIAELSFRNGICAYTQVACAQLGMVFRLVKDYQLATKMAVITEQLLQKFDFAETYGSASYLNLAFPLAYTRPWHEIIGGLMDSYAQSLAIGDLNGVGGAVVFLCYAQLYAGTNLRLMESDCRRYVHQLGELKNDQAEMNARSLWQCIHNLLGLGGTDDPCVLVGSALSEAHAQSMTLESGRVGFFYLPCFLCAVFANYEKGSELALENDGRFEKALSGAGMVMHWTFVAGINHFGMARKTKKQKYIKAGKKALSTIKSWAKHDNPNILHYLHFFEAEVAALKGKLDAAEVLYQKAQTISRRAGFIQDAAIINERYASFFLTIRKSPEDAVYKAEESIKLYEEWGCVLKADMLREEYRRLVGKRQIPQGTEFKVSHS